MRIAEGTAAPDSIDDHSSRALRGLFTKYTAANNNTHYYKPIKKVVS